MPFQPCPSIATSQIKGLMDSQLVIIDQAWFASGAITESSIANLAAGLVAWTQDVLAPLLSRDVSFNSVVVKSEEAADGPFSEFGVVATGGVDQEAAPNNVACCVKLTTGRRGRSFHGRNYVPAIPNNLITLNTIDETFLGDLLTAYNALTGAGAFVPGWELVVLSRVTGGVPRANGIGTPVLGAAFTSNKVRSMRSREIGHGA